MVVKSLPTLSGTVNSEEKLLHGKSQLNGQVAYDTLRNIYFGVSFLSKLMNLFQEARNEYFPGEFFFIR